MWLKLIGLTSISFLFIIYGVLWLKKSMSSKFHYDFKKDFKHTFLTPHFKYSAHLNSKNNEPQKIAPILIIFGGIFILIVGLVKIL